VDGNYVLDLNQTQALGYVHDSILHQRMSSFKYDRFLTGSVDCSNVPPSDYVDLLRE
jgi:hypothetical protein